MAEKARTESFKPSRAQWYALVVVFVLYGAGFGYYAAIQPMYQWRYFSWHPFLMTIGMITLPGIAAVTKKMGGYTNTKLHGIVSWLGLIVSGAGMYCIHQNKEMMHRPHYTSAHGKMGLGVFLSMVGLGLFGGVVLHPDFGVDRQNKTFRLAHKTAARIVLLVSWMTAVYGLWQLIPSDRKKIIVYLAPLAFFVPYSLM